MKKEVTVTNAAGLHARPAAMFVKEANKYKCDIKVEKEGKTVNAKSILGVLSLGVNKGTSINIVASGSDENEALEALQKLIENRFGEE